MKKALGFALILMFMCACGPKTQKVEKTTENGVEVVNNHLEPYKISGEPAGLRLEEEFAIDPEREDLARLGLMEIRSFDVDSKGNVYLFQAPKTQAKLVLQFDRQGNFLRSFG
jgi:hypothetical protein